MLLGKIQPWRVRNPDETLPDGTGYTRRSKPGEPPTKWIKVELNEAPNPPSSEPSLQLFLIHLAQSPGEPNHWALSACDGLNGNVHGKAWQVWGDATMMHYQHKNDVDLLNSTDMPLHAYYVLNRDLT